MNTYFYVKKQLLSRFISLRFARNRSFTALQLVLKTLKANNLLPRKLIALEVFGFVGTTTALDYAHLTDYLELWEYDPYYAKHAKKNIPTANVICGDSIKGLAEGKVSRRDFNFVVMDGNPYPLNDGSYESFGIFENSLQYLADNAVILVAVFTNLEGYFKFYGSSAGDHAGWIEARKKFFQLDDALNATGIDCLKTYEDIIKRNNLNLVYSNFISRNDYLGFGVFCVRKRQQNLGV